MTALVLRGGTVWTGTGASMTADVVIEDDAVVALPAAGTAQHGAATRVLDVTGSHVIPGLIDCHVHLVRSGGLDANDTIRHQGSAMTLLRAAANAVSTVMAGVTTVRDLGSTDDHAITLGRAVDAGVVRGPRVIASGRIVIRTGGHNSFWGIEADGPAAVLAAVRRQAARGASVIKVFASGAVLGGSSPAVPQWTDEELAVAVDEAHRLGLCVAVHAISETGIRQALAAGADTIEHGVEVTADLAQEMAERGVALVPTVGEYRHLARSDDTPPELRRRAGEVAARHEEALGHALAAGVLIAAGSDAGQPTGHPSLLGELQAMAEAGMTNEQVLVAATRAAAAALDLEAVIGAIGLGATADLVVVPGDPLADLTVLAHPSAVVARGQLIEALSVGAAGSSMGMWNPGGGSESPGGEAKAGAEGPAGDRTAPMRVAR